MAFPETHWLLNMSGPHFVNERWSMGLRLDTSDFLPDNSQEAQQQLCEDYAAAVVAGFTAGELSSGTQSKIDLIKFNRIGLDGRYIHSWTNLVEYQVPVAPTATSPHAPQVALAVTLDTGTGRGLARQGRIFVPSPTMNVAADGRFLVNTATNSATLAAAFINRINAVDPPRRVVVASSVREGAIRPVTAVAVGRVLDTIRTRRRSLEEERAFANVQGPA